MVRRSLFLIALAAGLAACSSNQSSDRVAVAEAETKPYYFMMLCGPEGSCGHIRTGLVYRGDPCEPGSNLAPVSRPDGKEWHARCCRYDTNTSGRVTVNCK